MMSARALLLFVTYAVCPFSGYAAKLTPAEEIIVKVERSGRVSDDRRFVIPPDISLIPPEQTENVAKRLREIAAKRGGSVLLGTVSIHTMEADLLLLRMGDNFTIERMIKDYRAYNSRTSWSYVIDSFEYSRQPKIIPYLAEDFYLAEDPNKGITTKPPRDSLEFAVSVPPRSIFSGVTVTRIIEKAPEFSPEMKAWAAQAYALRLKSPAHFRELMRVWWEANKTAFERGDYQAVIPVAEENPLQAATRSSIPEPNTPAPLPSPKATPSPAPLMAQTPAARSGDSALAWPWVVGIAALLVIVALALKRRFFLR